jgi:uncharacterized membrane protein
MNKIKDNLLIKNLFLLFYILAAILIILIGSNIINIVDICKIVYFFNTSLLNRFYPFIFLAFLGLIYEYLFKPKYKTLYSGIIPIFITLLMVKLLLNSQDNVLKNEISIVTKAVVSGTHNTTTTFSIYVIFTLVNKTESNKYETSLDITGKTGKCKNRISVGDTVLIMFSKECTVIFDIYKVCPTKAELEKCKNDCYLINGKLIPIDEYNNSKTKYLY